MVHNAVQATLGYAPRDGTRWVFNASNRTASNMRLDEHSVQIGNARPILQHLSFDRNGFVLLQRPTSLMNPHDPEEVDRVYLPEIEAIARDLTGAEKVVCFGTVTRTDAQSSSDSSQPARFAHVDFDARTVQRFAAEALGDEEASYWLRRRYMQINLWRPIRTVERMPLALADASTIDRSDLVLMETYGGLGDPSRDVMYGYALMHDPDQRWWYLPGMTPDEIWVFRLFDSDPSRVQLTAHTAFADPATPLEARPRESIEVRTIAFLPE